VRLAIDPNLLIAFLFASTRCAAFLFVSPPFQGLVPPVARGGLSLVLGAFLAPQLAKAPLPVDDTARIIALRTGRIPVMRRAVKGRIIRRRRG